MTSEILSDPHTRAAIDIVNGIPEGWQFLRTFEPEEGKGFVFSLSKLPPIGTSLVDAIMDKQSFHSGASLAVLLRSLQYISKQHTDQQLACMNSDLQPPPEAPPQRAPKAHAGETRSHDVTAQFLENMAQNGTPPTADARAQFLALPSNMSLAEQRVQMIKHWNTPMTYFEMRQRFG